MRGPKPSAALRELGLVPDVQVPEPNTWRDILDVMRDRPENRLALQEYGESNTDLIDGLRALGKEVTPVRIYGWDLPEDTGPLRQAAAKLIAGEFDVVLLTTSTQVVNLMRIARRGGNRAAGPRIAAVRLHRLDRPHHQRNPGRLRTQGRFRAQPPENGPAGQ